MDYQKLIAESLTGLKDPDTMKACKLKSVEINDDNSVTVILDSCDQNTNYTCIEREIAQRILSFEGVTQVQVEFH